MGEMRIDITNMSDDFRMAVQASHQAKNPGVLIELKDITDKIAEAHILNGMHKEIEKFFKKKQRVILNAQRAETVKLQKEQFAAVKTKSEIAHEKKEAELTDEEIQKRYEPIV